MPTKLRWQLQVKANDLHGLLLLLVQVRVAVLTEASVGQLFNGHCMVDVATHIAVSAFERMKRHKRQTPAPHFHYESSCHLHCWLERGSTTELSLPCCPSESASP